MKGDISKMRKYCWILLAIFFFAQGAVAAPLQWRLSQRNAGALLKLKSNTVAVIELDAHPSTGYVWDTNLPADGSVRILGRQFIPSKPGMIGSPGVEKIYVAGTRKGKAALAFALKRPHSLKSALKKLTFNFESEGKLRERFSMPKLNLPAVAFGGFQAEEAALMRENTVVSAPSIGLPQSFNWCDEHGCTPVKDQGQCGACWAFATVGVLENVIKAKDGQSVNLSEQYLISCNSEGYSCYGGWWAHEYHQWKSVSGEQEAGAVSENAKPYQARNGNCTSPNQKVAKILDWGYVGRQNSVPSTEAIKQAIYEHGPVTAAVCANWAFSNYSGGVFSGPGCPRVNHGVVLVGWNDAGGYWILRNSYGPNWGENGYMRIKYGVSNIGQGATWIDYEGGLNGGGANSGNGTSPSGNGCDGALTPPDNGGGCRN